MTATSPYRSAGGKPPIRYAAPRTGPATAARPAPTCIETRGTVLSRPPSRGRAAPPSTGSDEDREPEPGAGAAGLPLPPGLLPAHGRPPAAVPRGAPRRRLRGPGPRPARHTPAPPERPPRSPVRRPGGRAGGRRWPSACSRVTAGPRYRPPPRCRSPGGRRPPEAEPSGRAAERRDGTGRPPEGPVLIIIESTAQDTRASPGRCPPTAPDRTPAPRRSAARRRCRPPRSGTPARRAAPPPALR